MSRARDTANQINRVNSSAADATAITVTSLEKIGIGTDSPTGKLTVRSGTGQGEALTISSSSSGGNYVTHKHYSSGDIAYTGAGGGAAISAGTSNDYAIRANSGSLIFATGGNNERARFDGDGLKFHGDTAAANALNDYEEGTWTPRIVGSSSESGQSYQRQTGHYTKIGNKVFCRFILNFSARGSFSGDYIMDGFPFNCEGPADINLGSLYHSYVGQNVIYIGLYNRPNDNKAYIWIKTQAGQSREYPNSSFLTNDTELAGSFTIQTNS